MPEIKDQSTRVMRLIEGWLEKPPADEPQIMRLAEALDAIRFPVGKDSGPGSRRVVAYSQEELAKAFSEQGYTFNRSFISRFSRFRLGTAKSVGNFGINDPLGALAAFTKPKDVSLDEWMEKTSHWTGIPVPKIPGAVFSMEEKLEEMEEKLERQNEAIAHLSKQIAALQRSQELNRLSRIMSDRLQDYLSDQGIHLTDSEGLEKINAIAKTSPTYREACQMILGICPWNRGMFGVAADIMQRLTGKEEWTLSKVTAIASDLSVTHTSQSKIELPG